MSSVLSGHFSAFFQSERNGRVEAEGERERETIEGHSFRYYVLRYTPLRGLLQYERN